MDFSQMACFDYIAMLLEPILAQLPSEDFKNNHKQNHKFVLEQSLSKIEGSAYIIDESLKEIERSKREIPEDPVVEKKCYSEDYVKILTSRLRTREKSFKFILKFAGVEDDIIKLFTNNPPYGLEGNLENDRDIEGDKITRLRSACKSLKSTYKELSNLIRDQTISISARLESSEKKILKNLQFQQDLNLIKHDLQDLKNASGFTFSSSLTKLKSIFRLQESLNRLEKNIISPVDDAYIFLKFKDLEKNLKILTQKSLANIKKLENEYKGTLPEVSHKVLGILSGDIIADNYYVLADSFIALTGPLLALENSKELVLGSKDLKKILKKLDKNFVGCLRVLDKMNENCFERMKKVLQVENGENFDIGEDVFMADIRGNNLFTTAKLIFQKTSKILIKLTNHENKFEEFVDKIKIFEDTFYKFSTKLYNYLINDNKELEKLIPSNLIAFKDILSKLIQKISSLQENPPISITNHLQEALKIIKSSTKTIDIKSSLREMHHKEISQIKQEGILKIKDISASYDLIASSKNNIESALSMTKTSLEKSQALVEKLSKDCREKESELLSYKNALNNMTEELSEANGKYDQMCIMVNEMSNQVKMYQKIVREKERDIQELRASAGIMAQKLFK